MTSTILTLNHIAPEGLAQFPADAYRIASESATPDAILVRSQPMHDRAIPDTLLAVGRAGVGVNNIPVDKMSAAGIPVFNAPGANANAVKELVIAGMLLACRNICPAWDYARRLEGDDAQISAAVEAEKKRFSGSELPGRTLAVIGLGAIGVRVANAALALGMRVIGFDPAMTVQRAWQLSAEATRAERVEEALAQADFVTLHVPLIDATRNLLNAERLRLMKPEAVALNFARAGIVDEAALIEALDAGRIGGYVCDFPTARLKGRPGVVALPHLGASTAEAERNAARMAAAQVRDYLEHGNIANSVNFPAMAMPRAGETRLTIANHNIPNMVGQITSTLAQAEHNILDLLNRSRDGLAYNLVDIEGRVDDATAARIAAIEGVLKVRLLPTAAG